MNYAQKLQNLRHIMQEHAVQGYIIPRTDEYQGEYVADYAERLNWLTGFTGSAGLAIVTLDKAMIMSDGRYAIQLASEVNGDLFALENSQTVKPQDWVKENFNGEVIGYDPKLHTPSAIQKWEEAGVTLKSIDQNLIDEVWEDKPVPPMGQVTLFPEKFAGVSATEKVQNIKARLKDEDANAVILTLSDSIAWLLNIRGSDISFMPVALSYAIVPREGQVQWFIDDRKINDDVRDALKDIVVFLTPQELEKTLESLTGKVWLDTKRSSMWFQNKLSDVLEKDDPCILPRACKNKVEQKAMKQAHIRDGVAMVKFLKWVRETNVEKTEISVEKKLESFRAEAPEFKEPSFSTIAGYNAHGAIVHYRATDKTSLDINKDGVLLVDSGAQYEDGTTDITRTIAIGKVSDEIKERNTLVLKGHIALARAKFKEGTTGKELDALARGPLQEKGLDYAHGTGHGVGCYLSVHEDAAGIHPRGEEALKEGMILSNEPGYYKEGEYGIRIENLVITQRAKDGDLYFETITHAPIDKNLIMVEILSDTERDWFNDYHANVYTTLSPLLDAETAEWLRQETSPL